MAASDFGRRRRSLWAIEQQLLADGPEPAAAAKPVSAAAPEPVASSSSQPEHKLGDMRQSGASELHDPST